jgi:hypothetical protein
MHFGTGVIVGSMLLMTERGWRFWLVLLAMPFVLNGMIQGVSRGAFVGLAAGGLCLFWLKPGAYRKQFILFGVLGAIVFVRLANDFFLDRMSSLRAVTDQNQELDFSAQSRFVIAEAEWKMFLDHPFGAGYGGTTELSANYLSREYLTVDPHDPYAPPKRSSHNMFTSILVDQGIVGVVLLCALLVWVWTNAGLITKRSGLSSQAWGYGAAVAAALMSIVVAGQFAPYLKAEVQYWMLAVMLALKSLTVTRPLGTSETFDHHATIPSAQPAARR